MQKILIKPGREKALLRRHPWVFSGAIRSMEGNPAPGETVMVCNSQGEFLAYGAYSPESQIRVRVWSWDQEEEIGPAFFRSRLEQSIQYRTQLFAGPASASIVEDSRSPVTRLHTPAVRGLSSAVRLVYAESDGLPGLIVDRYEDTLILQLLSAGAEYWRETFAGLLSELTGISHLYERSDTDVRQLEGLLPRSGVLRGNPPEKLTFTEHGVRFGVDLSRGHKTGFYLDQRQNRLLARELVNGREVLDCFAYTGGFTVNALVGEAASVTAVDSSAEALGQARDNIVMNGFSSRLVNWIEADVFQQLRKFRDRGQQFDLILLDPPKFAPTASQVKKAARGYKDINLLAFKLLRPGGLLVTFSCSGGVGTELFQSIVAGAALDAGVSATIVDHLKQSPDHPVRLNFPEGAYLKGFVIQLVE